MCSQLQLDVKCPQQTLCVPNFSNVFSAGEVRGVAGGERPGSSCEGRLRAPVQSEVACWVRQLAQ